MIRGRQTISEHFTNEFKVGLSYPLKMVVSYLEEKGSIGCKGPDNLKAERLQPCSPLRKQMNDDGDDDDYDDDDECSYMYKDDEFCRFLPWSCITGLVNIVLAKVVVPNLTHTHMAMKYYCYKCLDQNGISCLIFLEYPLVKCGARFFPKIYAPFLCWGKMANSKEVAFTAIKDIEEKCIYSCLFIWG